jgi:hypothetical protein
LLGLLGIVLASTALMLLRSSRTETAASAAVSTDTFDHAPRSAPSAAEAAAHVPPQPAARNAPPAADDASAADEPEDAPRGSALGSPASRIDALVAAGFSAARAEEIVRREAELRTTAAYREYERTGTVRPLTGAAQTASEASLRAEIGEDDYERYLAALGRPTSINVASVAAESAAANAGLMPGDEIRTYAGERVFNLRELNESALRHSLGETVPLTVVRDGRQLQLYVTGGPLGLTPSELR